MGITKSGHRLSKKSQAAFEFLTTYGWAFVVILIAIGALSYFGVIRPRDWLPNRCTFGSEFQCLDYQVKFNTATGAYELSFRLKHNLAEPITVSSVIFESDLGGFTACSPAQPTPPAGLGAWRPGDTKDIVWTGCTGGGLVVGEKAKIKFHIKYNNVASGNLYTKEVAGEVLTNVI